MHSQTTLTVQPSFWDKIAPKYASKPVADPAAYDAKLTRVRALLRSDHRVLELGCGTGTTALHLAPNVRDMVATDVSAGMLSIAEEKQMDAGVHNLRFVQADAAAPMGGQPFDVINAFSLLHLVEDLPQVLKSVHGQLAPGGLFISKTVCLGDANPALRWFVRGLHLLGFAPKVAFLRGEDLRRALVRNGFDILEVNYFGKGKLNPFIVAQRTR